MPDLLESEHPVLVLRTAGGLYLITERSWRKVCGLRPGSIVPVRGRLEPFTKPVEVMAGTDARNPAHEIYRPISLNDLVPGPFGVRFHGRGMSNWARTSPVLAVYAGTFAEDVTPEGTYLVIGSTEAWHLSGGRATRFLESGWNNSTITTAAHEILGRQADPILMRIQDARLPQLGFDDFSASAPGWVPALEELTRALTVQGARIGSVFGDPVFGAFPELLLAGVPENIVGGPDPKVVAAVEEFDRECHDTCQDCGRPGGHAAFPSPYLLHHYRLCQTCRAVRMTRQYDEATVSGDLTRVVSPGENVTVWRSHDHLHLATRWGYTVAASFHEARYPWPILPRPHLLDLPDDYVSVKSLRDDASGMQVTDPISDPTTVLPGTMLEVAIPGQPQTGFTVLDTFHGTATSTIDDAHEFLVYQSGAHPRNDRVWFIDHGTASQILQNGWNADPDRAFDFDALFTSRTGEVGIIQLTTVRHGISGGRTGFDLFAPGWVTLLDDFLNTALAEAETIKLAHADVSPLTGEPIIRLTGVPANRWALQRQARKFRTECLRHCAVCGNPGRLISLPSPERLGSIRRCLCFQHEEEEYEQWNT